MLKTNLPVLILDDNVLLPSCEVKLEIEDSITKKILTLAESYFNGHLFVVFVDKKNPTEEELPKIGVIAQIKLKLDMPNGMVKLTLKGISRGKVDKYHFEDGIFDANVLNIESNIPAVESLANSRTLKKLFIEYVDNKKSLGNSIVAKIDEVNDAGELTDIIVGFMPLSLSRKNAYILEVDGVNRVMMLIDDLHYELSLLEYESSLDDIIERNLEDDQKRFILNEKLKIIQDELGIEENTDVKILSERIDNLDCPPRIKEKLNEELNRYKLCNSNSPEIGILRNYIDTLLSLPWNISTKENSNIESIRRVLNDSHYGLDDVKDRILEFVAAKKYTKSKSNPIICLVGPPGIGKTSLAKAIARALRRKCVKISVGGINDEAEITGHRRAYVGALPGKIITGIQRVGVNNPVFIIDEIDKMTKDIKGDPASSLLEALDKEQNDNFVDHFVEEGFDLSKVMFILTANYIDKIPNELKDRLEIIELPSYTLLEKISIVKNCLLKKLRLEYHLTKEEIDLSDETISYIINHYTKESGVRELERLLRKMCRKYICTKLEKNIVLDMNSNINTLLGKEKYSYQDNYDNLYGMVNVLSYHPLGGELIKFESAYYPGSGNIKSSGSLGDMMKESIELSFAYIKSHVKDFKLNFDMFQKNDFFIHLTDDGMKKEGPSAGVGAVTSILSLLKEKTIPKNISMTGEISLSGKIFKVGGIREKLILAMNSGIDTIYFPLDNKDDVISLSDIYNDNLNIKFVDNYMDIYQDLFKK
jgi:ATP-dependent Lon protease